MPELLIRVGLDDTDHPDWGCTTYDLNSLSELLRSVLPSYEEVERRLVRLWPYAERRTRGNAALCLLATIEEGDQGALYDALDSWVPEPGDADGTSSARPAIVAGSGDPPMEWYTDAVRSRVDLDDRLKAISDAGFRVFTKSERPHGAIGASLT